MNLNRRQCLRLLALAGGAAILPIGTRGWALSSGRETTSQKRLVVIFLEGGLDGLSALVPYGDPVYSQARQRLKIDPPNRGRQQAAIALDETFGLHPALEPLLPLWQQGSLALVHACGLPQVNHSHFDCRDYWATGTPGDKGTPDGWLNRVLATMSADNPTMAINAGGLTPRILDGTIPIANFPNRRWGQLRIERNPKFGEMMDRLYSGDGELSIAYRQGRQARDILIAERNQVEGQNRRGILHDVNYLARLLRGKAQTRIAYLSIPGWDTHSGQGFILNKKLGELATGLSTLVTALGETYRDTAIVVMSEFGRAVRENGNGGTEHGYGNGMWLLGGALAGGRFHGSWPGLDADARDLAVTTDYREVLASLLVQHLEMPQEAIARVFPGYQMQNTLSLVA